MKKSTKKKIRDIRSALVMVLVMVAMLSTASYAWFTMTDSPTVTDMQMTAASTGGLKVSWENDESKFKNAIDYSDCPNADTAAKILVPVHPTAAGKFAVGKYEGNEVTGLKELTSLKDHVAHYTVYLKSDEDSSKTVDIGIICGSLDSASGIDLGVGTNDQPTVGGSLVRAKNGTTVTGDTSTMDAPKAVRVGFVVNSGSTMYIWEPNSNVHNQGTAAVDKVTKVYTTADVISQDSGIITTGGNGESNTNISKGLFQITGSTVTPVDIYIWLEGTDTDCVNEIKTDYLEAQIQFTVVDEAAAVTP